MTEKLLIQGPVGQIEIFVDQPELEQKGFAVVCHPHPQQGGTPRHKVPVLLAQIFNEMGCVVYRPSFRGLDGSEGVHDQGYGETDDILAVIEYARQQHPDLAFYAGGFSFGSHVLAKCHAQLSENLRPKKLVLCGLPTGSVIDLRHYQTPQIEGELLLIHGEQDEITLLSDLIAWAKPQKHPITIMPGANHFFTGYLKQLKQVITGFLKI